MESSVASQSAAQEPLSQSTGADTGIHVLPSALYSKVACAVGATLASTTSRPFTVASWSSGVPLGKSGRTLTTLRGDDPAATVAVSVAAAVPVAVTDPLTLPLLPLRSNR